MEQRIGFGKRLGAYLLDCVIVGVLWVVVGSALLGMMGVTAASLETASQDVAATGEMSGAMMGAMMGMAVAIAVIAAVYFLMEAFTGYTLGKLILGIRIANADGSQAPVTTLLWRWMLKNISSVLAVLAFVTGVSFLSVLGNVGGLIMFVGFFLALGVSRQALHDRIAKTAVYPKAMIRAA